MSQKEMMRLVLAFSFILTMLISGVAAEIKPSSIGSCDALCIIECLLKKSPLCLIDCFEKCKAPPPAFDDVSGNTFPLDVVSENSFSLDGVTECAFSCSNSSCIKYISDPNKLKGCVGSCYKNCTYDP